jgi:hypothetical protein
VIPLLLLATVAADFAGTWVYRVERSNLLVLTLDARGGTVLRPKSFQLDSEGEVSQVSAELARLPVKWTKRAGEFTAGDERYVLQEVDREHATLANAELPWMTVTLVRAQPSDDLTVPSPWPQAHYAPEIVELQKQIARMVELDQAVRLADQVSHGALEEADRNHRVAVERIFTRYGWPKRSIVGREAAHRFWLLVQHQPPELQRRMLPELEVAARQGEASRSDYAYLHDRVRLGEGKPQRWGTQAKCVNGLPVLSPVEDRAGLEERRRELRMPPIREYLKGMKDLCRAMR